MNDTLPTRQTRHPDAHVIVVGLGGLGTPAVRALARAGVGRLTLWDPDVVERSNLPRQVLYADADVGRPKTAVAAAWVARHYPAVLTRTVARRFEPVDAPSIVGAAVIVDGTDSITSKFEVNDAAVAAGVPLVHAGATGLRAQLCTVLPRRTACIRCIFENPPPAGDVPECLEAGVLAPWVTLIGTLQAAEALRLVGGDPPVFAGRVVSLDARGAASRVTAVARRIDCPACASRIEDARSAP